MTRRAISVRPIACLVIQCIINPHLLSQMASYYDVASNICQVTAYAMARHVIQTHYKPSFIELNGIPRCGERYLPVPTLSTDQLMCAFSSSRSIFELTKTSCDKGPGRSCSPRQVMPLNPSKWGRQMRRMTWRAISAERYLARLALARNQLVA